MLVFVCEIYIQFALIRVAPSILPHIHGVYGVGTNAKI